MSGMFPNGGVPANQTQGATTDPAIAPGCTPLWYAPRCNPKFDPFAMNGLMSEIVEVFKCAGHTYDCTLQNNLSQSILALQISRDIFISGAIAQIVLAGGSTQVNGSTVGPTQTQQVTINNQSECASMVVSVYGECNYSVSGNGVGLSLQAATFLVSVNGGANQLLSSSQQLNYGSDNFVNAPAAHRRGIVTVVIPPAGSATLTFFAQLDTSVANWVTAAAYQTTVSGFAWYNYHFEN